MLGFQNCSAPGAFAQRVNNAIRAIIKHEEAPFTNGRPLTELSQEQLKDLLRHGTKRREQFQLRFAPPGSLGACSYERWSYLPNALQRRMDAIKKAYADRLLSDGMAELERSVPASSSALGPNPAASANPLNVLIARAVQPGASSASHATAEAQVCACIEMSDCAWVCVRVGQVSISMGSVTGMCAPSRTVLPCCVLSVGSAC